MTQKQNNKFEDIIEKSLLALKECDTIAEACEIIGISARSLQKKFESSSLRPPSFYLKDKNIEIATLDENQKKMVISMYSDISGTGKTVAEISKKLKVSKDTIKNFIKDNNITHEGLPVTPQQKKSLTPEKLFEIVDELRDLDFVSKLEAREETSLREDAQKWRNWKKNTEEKVFNTLKEELNKYSVKKLQFQTINDFCAVLSLQDTHYGRLASKIETGEDTDLEKQEAELFHCVNELISKVKPFGTPEVLYLTIGGDFLNSDNSKLETTKGTAQDSFPSHAHVQVKASILLVKLIDLLRQFFPQIHLINSNGNHDSDSGISLFLFVSAWFREQNDVISIFSENSDLNVRKRQYRTYGDNLLAFSHGDTSTTADMPVVIANEASEMWGRTKHRLLFSGHYHHHISKDISGVQFIQVPSLAVEDRWGYGKGFGPKKGAVIVLVDKQNGLMAEIFSNI